MEALLPDPRWATAKNVACRRVEPAMNVLASGQIDFMCDQTVTMVAPARSGIVRPLAVMPATRVTQLPDVWTVVEAGMPGVKVETWNAQCAVKGTPGPGSTACPTYLGSSKLDFGHSGGMTKGIVPGFR